MSEPPKVSIVLPVYNMEKCLRQTIDSLLNQSFRDYEMVCINDGSTDSSLRILREVEKNDDRVTVYDQLNKGQAFSRNFGLDIVSGEYVLLLDADDVYDVLFIEKMINRAKETDADIVVCKSVELDDLTGNIDGVPYSVKTEQLPSCDPFSVDDMRDCIFTAFVGWPWDKLYKRSFIDTHSLRFPILHNSEDLYFVFLSLVKADSISFVNEELILHRVGRKESVSNSRKNAPLAFYESICLLKKELKKDPSLYEKVSWGLLNWAFDYTLWNIETMDDEKIKKSMLKELLDGKMNELEIYLRATPFFSLEPMVFNRLLNLYQECILDIHVDPDEEPEESEEDIKHPWLKYPIIFMNECRLRGLFSAVNKIVKRISKSNDVIDEEEVEEMKIEKKAIRGSIYFASRDLEAFVNQSQKEVSQA